MKWYALYRDGELLGVRQWYGVPTVRDFGIGEMVGAEYKIRLVESGQDSGEVCLIIPHKA